MKNIDIPKKLTPTFYQCENGHISYYYIIRPELCGLTCPTCITGTLHKIDPDECVDLRASADKRQTEYDSAVKTAWVKYNEMHYALEKLLTRSIAAEVNKIEIARAKIEEIRTKIDAERRQAFVTRQNEIANAWKNNGQP